MKGFGQALKKDITRFAPLWGSWLVVLLVVYLRQRYDAYHAMTYPVFVYAGICAVTLFGDLYHTRRCYALHAMPLRREGWFLAHSLAGLLFFLVPSCVFYMGVALLRGDPELWMMALGFLGAFGLEFICFFGIALLCVMLAGSRIGAVLIYCVVSFLSPMLQWLLTELYQPFLLGVPMDTGIFDYLSPVLHMAQQTPGYYPMITCTPPFSAFYVWNGQWNYFLICSGVGLLAAALALLLYRRRKLENSGGFSVYRGLRYVFTTAFSLIAGVLMFQVLEHDAQQYYFLFLYIPIFYFSSAMVVERRFHVFQAGHLLSLGILAAVLFNSLWIIRYDALGINTYIPKPEQVRSVQVHIDTGRYNQTIRYENSYENWHSGLTVTALKDIYRVTDTHRSLLAEDRENKASMVYLTYTLKSGIRVRRYYPMDAYSDYNDQWEMLDRALATRKTLFGDVDWDSYVQQVYYIRVSNTGSHQQLFFAAPEEISDALPIDVKIHHKTLLCEFLDTLDEDCAEGNLSQLKKAKYTVCIKSKDRWGKEKTVEFGIPDAYTQSYSKTFEYIVYCWRLGYSYPDKTIPADAILTDYSQ